MRVMRREVKKELKIAEQKIKHQIKYCSVPSSILDEAKYRYTPGMTSRDLRPQRVGGMNKYEKCPWIGRIVPSKRMVPAQ